MFLHCWSWQWCDPPAGRLSDGPEEQFLSGTRLLPSLQQPAASTPDLPAAPSLRTHLAPSDVPQCQTSVGKGQYYFSGGVILKVLHCVSNWFKWILLKKNTLIKFCFIFCTTTYQIEHITDGFTIYLYIWSYRWAHCQRIIITVIIMNFTRASLSLEAGDLHGSVSSSGQSPPCCGKG